jgi:hypothetical protein
MFGRQRRRDADLIEIMRGELAATRAEMHAAIAHNNGLLDARVRNEVEQRERLTPMLVEGLERVRSEMATRDVDVQRALERVGDACDSLGEHLALERSERIALVDAIARLTMQLASGETVTIGTGAEEAISTLTPTTPTVIGGSITPAPMPGSGIKARGDRDDGDEVEVDEPAVAVDGRETGEADSSDEAAPLVIDLRSSTGQAVRHAAGVEVHCRFGDRWVDGFEIHEIVESDSVLRYRLRRCSDGYVLPTLFSDDEVRGFTRTPVATSGTPVGVGRASTETNPW